MKTGLTPEARENTELAFVTETPSVQSKRSQKDSNMPESESKGSLMNEFVLTPPLTKHKNS
jgi:hypothetical protein